MTKHDETLCLFSWLLGRKGFGVVNRVMMRDCYDGCYGWISTGKNFIEDLSGRDGLVYTAKNSLRNINPCKERPTHAKSILPSRITNKSVRLAGSWSRLGDRCCSCFIRVLKWSVLRASFLGLVPIKNEPFR